jgi:hypothetical protein
MTAVRGVVSDLIDRRLWPLALVLVAAAVAIPVLLLKPASSSSPPRTVASAQAPAAATLAVSLSQPAGGPVAGRMRDPFVQQHLPKAAKNALSASTMGPAKASAGGTPQTTSPSSAGVAAPSHSRGSHNSTPAAPAAVLEVRFGRADAARKKYDLGAGSPLPSPGNPLLVYLGQAKGGQSAFLVSSDAQPQGDGRCSPDRSICSTLYMKAGDTEFFDVTGPGGTVQYELEVLKLRS